MEDTHYLRHDYRKASLIITLDGLAKSIEFFSNKLENIYWYDALWFYEESEPIYGLVFIALQNYINSSIFDKERTLDNKQEFYKKALELNDSGYSKIDLINAVANYYKHRDDSRDLHLGTSRILNSFQFECHKDVDILESPIFKSLIFLTENWDFSDFVTIVSDWRENLWK